MTNFERVKFISYIIYSNVFLPQAEDLPSALTENQVQSYGATEISEDVGKRMDDALLQSTFQSVLGFVYNYIMNRYNWSCCKV